MTSIFGGAQTVPQTQNTLQNYVQNANQTSQQQQATAQTGAGVQTYAANPMAQRAGTLATDYGANIYYGMGSPAYDAQGNDITGFWGSSADIQARGSGPGSATVPLLQTAALTPDQLAGIAGLGGRTLPTAINALTASANPITGEDIGSFYNPMASNITANLQDIFGQQALDARIGGVSKTGGVGGDRAAIAQALLAKQQGLAAGQTYAGLYQSALQAAQQQKAQQLQAGLQGAQFGMQAAAIPQAQQQAINQALYQRQLGQYQDPFMRQAALLGSISPIAGLGGTGATAQTQAGNVNMTSAANTATTGQQTGTGQATTTYPAPPILPQIAGLGSLALGAGMLFGGSDKREKTDIQKFGNKDKNTGLQPYAFRYKGDPKHYPKVVGYMAQDVKKKLPGAVKEFARGGGIPHFQYGGQQQQQQQGDDTNYLTGFSDYPAAAGSEGSDAPTPPYAEEQSAWDPKRIFSPDRLQKAQRAIALAQKATQQRQIAQPRVAPITFPQVPWKSGITFQRGGRLAINLPMLNRAIAGQQEGGRVDAMTAKDWGPGQTENYPRYRALWDQMLTTREPWRGAKIRTVPQPNARQVLGEPGEEPGIYRLGGFVRGYQDGGEVDEAEPPGLPEYEDMPDTGDEAPPLVPLPTPRPPGAGAGAGFTPAGGGGGGLPAAPRSGGMSPGAMALIQAGLGMLAASGQRDARGLPMSGLAAIGKGGAMGMESYQTAQEQQRKDALARDTLAQRNLLAREQLAMRGRAQKRLEEAAQSAAEHRRALEAIPRIIGYDKYDRPIRGTFNRETGKWDPVPPASGVGAAFDPEDLTQDDDKKVADNETRQTIRQQAEQLMEKEGVPWKTALRMATQRFGRIQTLRPSDQKELDIKGTMNAQQTGLENSFQDDYTAGGMPEIYGEAKNYIARQFGLGNKDAANWWQSYQAYKADVRHGKYGAALTKYEIAQWNLQDINPGMPADVIKANLGRQNAIVQGAMRRRAESLMEQGYSRAAIEKQIGVKIEDLPEPIESKQTKERKQKETEGKPFEEAAGEAPEAPPREKREMGKKYKTPKGILKWTEHGWEMP